MRLFSKLMRNISLTFSVLFIFTLFTGSALAQDGEQLFKANCTSCHKMDKVIIGPALDGIENRWEDDAKLTAWIKNSQQYLKDNPDDSYAQELYKEYNEVQMTAQALSDEQVGAIITYMKTWEPPVEEKQVVVDGPAGPTEDYSAYWLLGLLVVVLIVIKILMDVKSSLKEVKAVIAGEEPQAPMTFVEGLMKWINENKKTFAALVLVILATSSVQLWFVVKNIGVYEGYAPTQPIKFSHKIHAGDNEIDCAYCHGSAYKGKNAGIPSVNICMNCHTGIPEGKLWGTEEIAKIYDAAGYDPEKRAYTGEEKPIEWVRIHNLPDFAYFNHSQHVVVGKQKCQTCHGPVEEFGYPMKQHSSLTMGWCIDCHRNTPVAMKGNGYYDKIHEELKERYKDKPISEFTVEHIGGLECAKCHY